MQKTEVARWTNAGPDKWYEKGRLKIRMQKAETGLIGRNKKGTDSYAVWEPRNKLREKAKASKTTRHRIQKKGIDVKENHNLKDKEKS